MVRDSGSYERTPLSDFTFAPFDQRRWFPASDGLQSVRGLIAELESKLASSDDKRKPSVERDIAVLRAVEDRLDTIDMKDFKFHFLARDLE